jgi:hypothetical protein
LFGQAGRKVVVVVVTIGRMPEADIKIMNFRIGRRVLPDAFIVITLAIVPVVD